MGKALIGYNEEMRDSGKHIQSHNPAHALRTIRRGLTQIHDLSQHEVDELLKRLRARRADRPPPADEERC